MPILNFHLVDDQFSQQQHEQLLLDSSRVFADILRCPIERVRAFITLHRPGLVAVGGELVSNSAARAPYFSFTVLAGRPLAERHALLARFTDIVVDVLEVERALVRGGIELVQPEDWSIGGVPASALRQAEVHARAQPAQQAGLAAPERGGQ